MKKEITFITDDGKKFKDEQKATEHERKLCKQRENRQKYTTITNGMVLTHDDIVDYFNHQMGCENCTFHEECEKMYDRIRRNTTEVFSLCSVIKNKH